MMTISSIAPEVLILTKAADTHAMAVECALNQKGIVAHRWIAADIPSKQTVSATLGCDTPFALKINPLNSDLPCFESAKIRTVWNRRPGAPYLPAGYIDKQDEAAADREWKSLWRSVERLIAPDAFWVNDIESLGRAKGKLLQLQCAQEIGLKIPRTVIGNSPTAIRKFVQECDQRGGAIYKPFFPVRWQEKEHFVSASTTRISAGTLPSDDILSMTPGIFQERLTKKFEVRAFFFGKAEFAFAIDSQIDPLGIEDYRLIPLSRAKASLIKLPSSISDACQALMRRLGIVSGSFDFVVQPDGNYVFLEVNEAGQFLFLEQWVPEAHLLDAFTDFLIQPSQDFVYEGRELPLLFADIANSPELKRMWHADLQEHVYRPDPALGEGNDIQEKFIRNLSGG